MKHTLIENAIPLNLCSYILDFFENNKELHFHKSNNPNVVKINQPWKHLRDVLEPVLQKYIDTSTGQRGNIYKHTNRYTAHVDSGDPKQMINALIPIHIEKPKTIQKFVVFDQWIDNGTGVTWEPTHRGKTLDYNKQVRFRPWEDSRVKDKTSNNIDIKFFRNYLQQPYSEPWKYYKGLSGVAYDFVPGNLILFNSNNIHCTGRFVGEWKIGMHIQFEGTVSSLLNV